LFERAFGEPVWIGVALLITGGLLILTVGVRRPSRGWTQFHWWHAALVGVAQGFAIMPGISRSGATICTALYCGLRRRWAAQFSFLIAAPAILGATAITARSAFDLPAQRLEAVAWGPVVVGSVVSAAVGVAALSILLTAVQRAKLHYFAWYCWLLGGLVVAGLGG
jgi:undecaprenyl-diphosphatase